MLKMLEQLAIRCGATKAVVISSSQVVTSSEFRKICEGNGCGKFGKCWVCPPFIGDIEELMPKIFTYSYGLLYQTISAIEDSFDIEGMFEAGYRHAAVSQAIQKEMKAALAGEFLHLTCGGCRLCEHCARETGEPCRFPDQALPSLEGYGVDVYNTTKDTDLKYINGANTVTYFGMVLFSE